MADYKEITVYLPEGVVHVHGEHILDTDEGTLILFSRQSTSQITLNWDKVLCLTVSDPIEGEEDFEEAGFSGF